MGLLDSMRNSFGNAVDNARAHPFQTGLSFLLGAAGGPLAGRGSQLAFDKYNTDQFNTAADASTQTTADQGNAAQNAGMNAPLDGPLGQFDNLASMDQALTGGYTPSGSDPDSLGLVPDYSAGSPTGSYSGGMGGSQSGGNGPGGASGHDYGSNYGAGSIAGESGADFGAAGMGGGVSDGTGAMVGDLAVASAKKKDGAA